MDNKPLPKPEDFMEVEGYSCAQCWFYITWGGCTRKTVPLDNDSKKLADDVILLFKESCIFKEVHYELKS